MEIKLNFFCFFHFLHCAVLFAEEKITTTPLINLDNLKPSFEEPEEKNENLSNKTNIKIKKKKI